MGKAKGGNVLSVQVVGDDAELVAFIRAGEGWVELNGRGGGQAKLTASVGSQDTQSG